MPQLTHFPKLPPGEPGPSVAALIEGLRGMPAEGLGFRPFRGLLKRIGVWDRERLPHLMGFLRMAPGDHIVPGPVVQALQGAEDMAAAERCFADRLWAVNPLLFATVLERLGERVHSEHELLKYIDSFAYAGVRITGPEFTNWLRLCKGLSIFKTVGIRLAPDDAAAPFLELARDFEVDEFLEEDEPEPALTPAPATDALATAAEPGQVEVPPAATQSVPVAKPAPVAAPEPARPASTLASPFAMGPAKSRRPFAMDDDHRGANRTALTSWWQSVAAEVPDTADIGTYGLTGDDWRDDPERTLLQAAVAAALAFKLGAEGPQAFAALRTSGALDALHDGVLPTGGLTGISPEALMLASVIARRCAEAPDLAAELERAKSGREVFDHLDAALGRGLMALEIFWLCRALAKLGAARPRDHQTVSAVPTRAAQDTLFRLGLVDSPYAESTEALLTTAGSAHQAVPVSAAPERALAAFSQAAGCSYGCRHTAECTFYCRERIDRRC